MKALIIEDDPKEQEFLHRVAGLALGADDHLPKPCAMAELKARIMAFNRRFKGTGG